MSVQKFQVKLAVQNADGFDVEKLIPVFHAVIRDKKLDELAIDVADYGHVEEGPGVVLIGYGSDYYLDLRDGEPGLQYSRKRGFVGDEEAAFTDAVRRALTMASLLEQDASLGGVRFSLANVVVRINDRGHAVNDEASFARFSPLFAKVLGKAFGSAPSLSRTGEARDLLTVRTSGGQGSVADALARLSA